MIARMAASSMRNGVAVQLLEEPLGEFRRLKRQPALGHAPSSMNSARSTMLWLISPAVCRPEYGSQAAADIRSAWSLTSFRYVRRRQTPIRPSQSRKLRPSSTSRELGAQCLGLQVEQDEPGVRTERHSHEFQGSFPSSPWAGGPARRPDAPCRQQSPRVRRRPTDGEAGRTVPIRNRRNSECRPRHPYRGSPLPRSRGPPQPVGRLVCLLLLGCHGQCPSVFLPVSC